MVKSSFITKLHEMITDGSLPPACWQHRVVTIDPSPNSPLTPCCALGAVRRRSAIRPARQRHWLLVRMSGHKHAHPERAGAKMQCAQVRLQGMVQLVHTAHGLALVLFSSHIQRMAKTTARRRKVGSSGRLARRACGQPAAKQSGSGHAVHAVETPTPTTRAPSANGRCGSTGQPKSCFSERLGGTSAMVAPRAAPWHWTCRHCVSLSMTGSNHPPCVKAWRAWR